MTGQSGHRHSVAHGLLGGLNASASGNAQSFGFSITVTVTFGLVNAAEGSPSPIDLVGFAMAAVAAFSLLNVLVVALMREHPQSDPGKRVLFIGTATDFLAVGAAVGMAFIVTDLANGWLSWTLTPFISGLVYVVVQSIEFAVGRDEAGED